MTALCKIWHKKSKIAIENWQRTFVNRVVLNRVVNWKWFFFLYALKLSLCRTVFIWELDPLKLSLPSQTSWIWADVDRQTPQGRCQLRASLPQLGFDVLPGRVTWVRLQGPRKGDEICWPNSFKMQSACHFIMSSPHEGKLIWIVYFQTLATEIATVSEATRRYNERFSC